MLGFGTNPRHNSKTKEEIISKIPILAASHASSLSNLSVCLYTRHLFLVHPWWNLEVRGVELSAVEWILPADEEREPAGISEQLILFCDLW